MRVNAERKKRSSRTGRWMGARILEIAGFSMLLLRFGRLPMLPMEDDSSSNRILTPRPPQKTNHQPWRHNPPAAAYFWQLREGEELDPHPNHNPNQKILQPAECPIDDDPSLRKKQHKFLDHNDARHIVTKAVQERLNQGGRILLSPIVGDLYAAAARQRRMLLTLQVGAGDGKTRDSIFRGMALARGDAPEGNLQWWLPVAVEAAPDNFRELNRTYAYLQKHHKVRCPLLLQEAISYENSVQRQSTCKFCSVRADACDDLPDWLRRDVNSLDCAAVERFFTKEQQLEKCVERSSVQCRTLWRSLWRWKIDLRNVALLRISLAGFEDRALRGLFQELESDEFPPIISFDSQLLEKRGNLEPIISMLRDRGYMYAQTKRMETILVRLLHADDAETAA